MANPFIPHFPGQPLPQPGPYNPDPLFANPYNTIPGPPAASLPYPQWGPQRNPLSWENPRALDSDYVTVGYWQSPDFDLRPEIKAADGSRPSGIPIHNSSGRKLWVQITGLLSSTAGVVATDALYVASREYGNISDPQAIVRISATADISDQVAAGTEQQDSVILSFSPPGSGYNVRYWRLELAFRRLDRLTFPLTISAAFY